MMVLVAVAVVESSVSIASTWENLWILPDDGLRWINLGWGEFWSMSSSEGRFASSSSSSFSPLAAVAVIVVGVIGEEE